ncbi:MAG: HEAT repeat domain-containing protein [Planctomycetota bacterium]
MLVTPAWVAADQDAFRQLREQVLTECGPLGERAAAELFSVAIPEYDDFLRRTLESHKENQREARLCVLRALSHAGLQRPEAAFELAAEALIDPSPNVATQAADTLVALEDQDGRLFRFLSVQLRQCLSARPGSAEHKRAEALIDVVERLRNEIESAGVLVSALESRPASQDPALTAAIWEALNKITFQTFDSAQAARQWYADVRKRCGGSLSMWRREKAASMSQRLERYEQEAAQLFERLIRATGDDPTALTKALQDTLSGSTVPGVRRAAIERLGDLAEAGEKNAVALLRDLVTTGGLQDSVLAISALGRTRDPALLEVLVPFLARERHPRLRVAAIRALGTLGASGGIDPLLALLNDLENPVELLQGAIFSLGQIGENPSGRVARSLVRFARGIQGQEDATALLKDVAEALGKLNYTAGDTAEVVALLENLAFGTDEANVRLYAATSLGSLPAPEVLPRLQARLPEEPQARVQKALLASIGEQALRFPAQAEAAIGTLVLHLDHPEEKIRRKVQECLVALSSAERDPQLRHRLRILKELGPARLARALPYLETLPAIADAPQQPEGRAIYAELLEARSRARLAARRDLADLDLRALIQLGQPLRTVSVLSSAFDAAFPADVAAQEAEARWGLLYDALKEGMVQDPAAARDALAQLQPRLSACPAPLQAKFAELKSGS